MSQNSELKWTGMHTFTVITGAAFVIMAIMVFIGQRGYRAELASLQEQAQELREAATLTRWQYDAVRNVAAVTTAEVSACKVTISALEKKVYTCVACKDEGGTACKGRFTTYKPFCGDCGKKRDKVDLHQGIDAYTYRISVVDDIWCDSVTAISAWGGR